MAFPRYNRHHRHLQGCGCLFVLKTVPCNLFDVSSDELFGIESKNRRIREIAAEANSFAHRGYGEQAKYYALNRQESETLHHLNKATEHAIAFVTAEKGSVHTSLLFRGDPLRGFLTDDKRNDASRVLHEMEKERYDFVREHEEFIKMTEALRTYAGNWKAEI